MGWCRVEKNFRQKTCISQPIKLGFCNGSISLRFIIVSPTLAYLHPTSYVHRLYQSVKFATMSTTPDGDSVGLATNLAIGVTITLVCFLLFDILRNKFPGCYYYREFAATLRSCDDYDDAPLYAPERPPSGVFGWIRPVVSYPEDQFIKTHGLDAALYVRFLRICTMMFGVLGCFMMLWLAPTYGTASNKNREPYDPLKVSGVAIVSLANVPPKDWRMWFTLVSEIVLLVVLSFFIHRELAEFKRRRLQYRSDSVRNPSNYAVLVLDIPSDGRSQNQVRDFFNRCFPGEVAEVHHVRNAGKLEKAKLNIIKTMKARECAEWSLMRAQSKSVDTTKKEAALSKATDKQHEAESRYRELMQDLETNAPYTSSALVMFHNKRAATLAASTPLWNRHDQWKVERAGEPKAVNWPSLSIHKRTAFIRTVVVTAALTALCMFWFIPVAFLQGLANLTALSETRAFRFLRPVITSTNPTVVRILSVVEGALPPLVLTVFLILVPIVFRIAIAQERIGSKGGFESKVRTQFFVFLVFSNFVFVVLAGVFLDRLQSIINNFTFATVVGILGNAVPKQASFLMTYVLINAFMGSPLNMLNPGRLVVRPLLTKVFPATKRVIHQAEAFGVEFQFFKFYATNQVIAFITIIYSNIAPLILFVATIYFGLSYITAKCTLMYSSRQYFETGGSMQSGAWYSVLVALYVHQLSLVGVLSLKAAAGQATIATVMFSVTVGISIYFRKSFRRITELGSLVDQMDADNNAELVDKIPPHFIDHYKHPGVRGLLPEEAMDLTGCPPELEGSEFDRSKKVDNLDVEDEIVEPSSKK